MEAQLKQISTGKDMAIELSDNFSVDYNEHVVHRLVTAYQAKARSGSKQNKSRSDVSGGGKKPWRQKGTGNARAGTTRGPLWRSGGVTFAARPRDYSQKVNRKFYRAGLRTIFSQLLRESRLSFVDDLVLETPKTKALLAQLDALKLSNVYIISADLNLELYLASRNLHHVHVGTVSDIHIPRLLSHDHVLITKKALEHIEERIA